MDMQERIAARRAEIERQRRAAGTAGDSKKDSFGDETADISDIFEELVGTEKSAADAQTNRPAEAPEAATRFAPEGKVQDRVAERRAEVDRERAEAAAATKAETDARRAAELAVAERAWVEEARARKAEIDQGTAAPASGKGSMDEVLRIGVGKRWTAGEKLWVILLGVGGVLLLGVHPVVGGIPMLLAAGLYFGTNSKYRHEIKRDYPDLFGADSS